MNALRILIADDEATISLLLADVLADMGYDVCAIAATEADAVLAAAQFKLDLMIVDACLGAGSGISAVKQILRAGFIPHVFISGDILMAQALDPGAVVLQKPFLESDLTRAIQLALSAAGAL